ncbi:MAG: hypothetical protein C4538_08125 [Nitrospiraceae bacterium]|nr:MAG: hypothetical protein C4538_08125 [Nitrospiraceae bacterium]
MGKMNCWEIKKCGREPGGSKVKDLGVCPAATDSSCTGVNCGEKGGRVCWAVAGTFCGGKIQCSFAQKQVSCMSCEVFKKIKNEEGNKFTLLKTGQIYQTSVR